MRVKCTLCFDRNIKWSHRDLHDRLSDYSIWHAWYPIHLYGWWLAHLSRINSGSSATGILLMLVMDWFWPLIWCKKPWELTFHACISKIMPNPHVPWKILLFWKLVEMLVKHTPGSKLQNTNQSWAITRIEWPTWKPKHTLNPRQHLSDQSERAVQPPMD
jgi:hypothetical protein